MPIIGNTQTWRSPQDIHKLGETNNPNTFLLDFTYFKQYILISLSYLSQIKLTFLALTNNGDTELLVLVLLIW